jgi:DNA replication protein DnaC
MIDFVRSGLNNISIPKLKAIQEEIAVKDGNALKLANRYYESNIPLEFWKYNFEKNFIGTSDIGNIYTEYTKNYKSYYMDGKSFHIAGPHGTGKTFLLTSLLKFYCKAGRSCLYTTLGEVVNFLTTAPTEQKYLARAELIKTEYLVLDEFDNRFILSNNAADLYNSVLEMILRVRLQNKMSTFISSNSPDILESFQGPLKESLTSLFKRLDRFKIFDKDFRGQLCLPKTMPSSSTENTSK